MISEDVKRIYRWALKHKFDIYNKTSSQYIDSVKLSDNIFIDYL